MQIYIPYTSQGGGQSGGYGWLGVKNTYPLVPRQVTNTEPFFILVINGLRAGLHYWQWLVLSELPSFLQEDREGMRMFTYEAF